jgi:uncharacterized protein (TIGR00288 family)
MQNFINAPHRGDTPGVPTGAPNAALLIDFDNVTMGIRSDLTRQLKDLLNSDIIRGKVAVQRAYADWRRYAQYIVPLSEASVDLIFAPAYGSSKKNATDIRLAIDALELVFTRPEIGVYILLSGDSDFSSLVLKLKEYGKYVIGVGLRESASDLLVQNCDEYYSYSSLTGLTKAGEEDTISAVDPWDLVERAVTTMADENDVMRSDRLKQVMLDLDPSFDESELGYSKFNKFLTEAASKSRLALKKLDNGQYEVQPFDRGGATKEKEERRDDRKRGRGRRREEPKAEASKEVPQQRGSRSEPRAQKPAPQPKTRERRSEDLKHGYDLLQKAIQALIDGPGGAARDSDIKRQMLEIESGWDESELGFTKFSRFLRQAHDAEVIDLQRTSEGYHEARLPSGVGSSGPKREHRGSSDSAEGQGRSETRPAPDAGRARQRQEPATQATAPAEDRAKPEDTAEPKAEAARPEPRPEPKKEEAPVEAGGGEQPAEAPEAEAPKAEAPKTEAPEAPKAEAPKTEAPKAEAPKAETEKAGGRRSGPYGRRGRRGQADGPPPLLPGQVVGGSAASSPGVGAGDGGTAAPTPEAGQATAPEPEPEEKPEQEPEARDTATPPEPAPQPEAESAPVEEAAEDAGEAPEAPVEPEFDPDELGLPTDEGAVIRYLSNSYQGVGQKTAEVLIETFGASRVFNGLNSQPDRVREVLGSGRRTDILLDAWARDYRRRTSAGNGEKQPVA